MAARLPAVGEYGLEIYACEPLRDGDTYVHICQYLVVFDHDVGVVDGQAYDRLDLTHGIKADSEPFITHHGENPVDEDTTPAKDNQLHVRKEDISSSYERIHTSVCVPFLPRDASAERGNATVSRPSVCLSVRLSVCDV